MVEKNNQEGITEWTCGGCGKVHGWVCPIYGSPGDSKRQHIVYIEERRLGRKLTAEEADRVVEEDFLKRVAAYNGHEYRVGNDLVRGARRTIDQLGLPDEQRAQVLAISKNIALGILLAARAIYNLPTTKAEYETLMESGHGGSAGDLETDKKGLEKLPEIFK